MKKKKKIIRNLVILIILLAIILIFLRMYQENKIKEKSQYNAQKIDIQEEIESSKDDKIQENEDKPQENIEEIPQKEYIKEDIITEYKGYEVAAKLQIPKINLETYILKNYSVKALKVSPTKFWGADANKIGNFCVAGHNYKNKNMFYNLKDLEIGDRFFISDNEIGKVEYEIYNIYKVEPKDVSCLAQNTDGKREVTLITCTIDIKKRIIIKAREIEE